MTRFSSSPIHLSLPCFFNPVQVSRHKHRYQAAFFSRRRYICSVSIDVQAQFASFVSARDGLTHLEKTLTLSSSTAPAYAFLATIAKDHGAMTGTQERNSYVKYTRIMTRAQEHNMKKLYSGSLRMQSSHYVGRTLMISK